jgi:hypothetical protein
MGHTIWVDVQGRSENDLPADNSIMLRLEDQLDRLSEKLRVARLSDFYDYSELEAEYGEFADDADDADAAGDGAEGTPSEGSWFEPAQALAAVRAVREHLARHPEDLGFTPDASRRHWPDNLMEELTHCQAVLEDAASRGRRIRFLIVP